jgi:hypothetical protein
MPNPEAPKELGSRETAGLVVLALVIGALLFAAFSFITLGVPLMVVAVGGLIWIYVGIMRWIDRAFVKRAGNAPSQKSR